MDESIKNALITLGINLSTGHPPKMKFVTKRYHELSMIHHPDRPTGDNPLYQNITQAYRLLGDYISTYYKPDTDDTDEEIAMSVYRSFNFDSIKENLCSFTIKIDNTLSLIWENVLIKHYGEPMDRKMNGKHWKHLDYTDDNLNRGDITIGKWHIPKKDKQS